MQLPLRAFRGIYRPIGRPRIDWSHPLTQGLVYAAAMSEGGGAPQNLVRGAPAVNHGMIWGLTNEGQTLLGSRASSTWFDTASNLGLSAAGQLSIFARVRHDNLLNSAPEAYCTSRVTKNGGFVLMAANALGSAPNRNFQLQFTLGTVVQYSGSPAIFGLDGTIGNIGMSFIANNAAGLSYYANGALLGSRISTSGNFMAAGENVAIGGSSTFETEYFNGAMPFIFLWNRALSDQEHAQLDKNPTCFLIYPDDDLLAALVGTSGPSGALSGASSAVSGAIGSLSGTGALAGTSSAISGAAATLTNASTLAGTSAAVSGAAGTLSGLGALSAGSAAASTVSGGLSGTGALAGASAAVSGATGSLVDGTVFRGTSAAVSGATATLSAIGALVATAPVISGLTGTIRDGNPANIWSHVPAPAGDWTPVDPVSTTWSAT